MNNQAAQTMPAKFRKKPVVIDALQYTGRNQFEVMSFVDGRVKVDSEGLIIPTLEGQHIASPGDWIIRGVKGEFYPCKPDIFAMTYEPAAALSQTAGVAHLMTGVPDKDGREICAGDRIVYRNASQYTKEEYWNPEYIVEWKAPAFVLRHVGGGKDDSNASFAFNVAVRDHYWAIKLETIAAAPAASGGEAEGPLSLCEQLQQKCSQWGTYWRAPDAHGVILNQDQAMELLRDALGVEVEVSDWTPGAWSKLETWLGTYADSIPNEAYHELCAIQKLMNPKPQPPAGASVSERAREILSQAYRDAGFDKAAEWVLQVDLDNDLYVLDRAVIRALEQALTQQRGECVGTWQGNAAARGEPGGPVKWADGLTYSSIPDGTKLYTTPQPGAEALRELVQRWRDKSQLPPLPDAAYAQARVCARELESLMARGVPNG